MQELATDAAAEEREVAATELKARVAIERSKVASCVKEEDGSVMGRV